MIYRVSAPGSILLLGEHAVLRGYPSVVASLDHRLWVTLSLRKDHLISIKSNRLGTFQASIEKIEIQQPFQFVSAALLEYIGSFPCGFDLNIISEFSEKVGLGSSAAVTVATLGALQKWLLGELRLTELYEKGVAVIRRVQGQGSGADVAASVFGGILAYQCFPSFHMENLLHRPKMVLVYCGYKTPTAEVIKQVNQKEEQHPQDFVFLFQQMGQCVCEGIEAIQQADWYKLAEIFRQHQQLQQMLGVSDKTLEYIIRLLEEQPKVLAAKISGSGLGDCVVALGEVEDDFTQKITPEMQQISVMISNSGVKDESEGSS